MSDDGERLIVLLEARIRDFEKQMQKAERTGTGSYNRLRRGSQSATREMEADMLRSSSRINQAMASVSSNIGTFGKAFAGGLVGGVVGAAFSGFSRNLDGVIRQVAQIGDEAKRAGVEVEAFQQWGYVARQNRIDIGALTDGFKELNLRADEFVVTGKGSAAEAFTRLGYTANDLKTKLQDPSALMLEIIGRMEGLDKAAQIRIADEIFGGTGGERFVELLGQGENGIRKVMDEAKSAGIVIDAELVQRADDLDKRFAAIQERLASGFKNAVVSFGDTLFGDGTRDLAEMMRDFEQIRMAIGEESFNGLIKAGAFAEESAASIAALNDGMQDLTGTASDLATVYFDLADAAFALGDAETGKKLAAAGAEMDKLVASFKRGKINAGELITKMMEVKTQADAVVDAISDANAQSMADIIAQVDGLSSALSMAAGLAQRLWSIMGGGGGGDADSTGQTTGTPLSGEGSNLLPPESDTHSMTSSPRPQRPGVDSFGDWQTASTPKATGGGGKGGGGGRGNNRLDALVEDLKTEREILEEWYQESLDLLNGATEAQLEALGGKHEAIERLELDHKERLAEIDQMTNASRLSEMGDFFGSMASLTAAGGDKLVKATRLFGAVEAFLNTKRAQAQVLADPKLGFFGKMAAYASIGAAGFGVIQAIRGGSSGGGGGGGGGGFTSAASPAAETVARPQDVILDFSATMDPVMRALAKALAEPMIEQLQRASKTGVNVVGARY